MESFENIELVTKGSLATLILKRPQARNSMTVQMGQEIVRAVATINSNPEIRVVLVRGAGKDFSAGGDLEMIRDKAKATPQVNYESMLKFYGYFLTIRDLRIPSLAVMHGWSVGAGVCFAAACDFRIAAANARFSLNFVRLGLPPGMGGTHLIPKLVGQAKANELLLTGKVFDAVEAHRIGLVNEIVPEAELDNCAQRWAQEISLAAPLPVRLTKEAIRLEQTLEKTLQAEAKGQALSYNTDDLTEGVRAMVEKSIPQFKGH